MTEPVPVATPAQVRAFDHPMRHRIWREVGTGDSTVSQLTNRLATNKGHVAPHVKGLLHAGLPEPSRTRTVRGGTEQYYATAVPRLRLPDGTDASRAMFATIAEEAHAARAPLGNHRT